ncbi:MAG: chromophore lyase CpcT/CpeT [Bacteroidota bacterium]
MKKQFYQFLLLSTILPSFFLQSVDAQNDPNARDLIKLTEWFEGEFDNDSQIWYENRYGWKGDPEERHNRMHTFHKRIDFPELGNHVFYVEEFIDDDPTKIARQRIVSFSSEAPETKIRMAIYFLRDAKKYLGTYAKPEIFKGISKEDLFGLDGCDVFFTRQGEQYHGSMEEKACQFGEGDLRRYSVHDMIISENQYWRVDRTFLTKDDSFHKGHPTAEPHKMRKAKYYSCDVAFHEKAYYIPSEKDKKYKATLIHDQGGMAWFDNPIDGKTYGVQLRQKEYPFYTEGSDFFMLRFIEKGKKASTVIVTGELHTEKISFQIGWASAACYLQED